ncbi:MAG: hypothetical protein ACKORE_08255 [Bacteroidota bacterium]
MVRSARILVLLLLHAMYALASPNDTTALTPAVNRLSTLGDSLLRGRSAETRTAAQLAFAGLIDSILSSPSGMHLSFHQVRALSVAESPDKNIRMLTWMLRAGEETDPVFHFSGYILCRQNTKSAWNRRILRDSGVRNRDSLAFLRNGPEEWTGGICYGIAQSRTKTTNTYLLLYWCPQSKTISRKIAETFQLRNGLPVFGVPAIKAGGKSRSRLVFDFNAQASMTLRFDERMNKVIMDHLSPSDPRPEAKDQYQLYGPDLSYDALSPDKGTWLLIRNIDVRNR